MCTRLEEQVEEEEEDGGKEGGHLVCQHMQAEGRLY
jgi:hypothetical protein